MAVSIGSNEVQKAIQESFTIVEDIKKILVAAASNSKEASDSLQGNNPLLVEICNIFEEELQMFIPVEKNIDKIRETFGYLDKTIQEGIVGNAQALASMH
jgi:hypothetical protein